MGDNRVCPNIFSHHFGEEAMTPEQIAAGLTKAQRFWVLQRRQPVGLGKWPVQNALIAKGLATVYPWQWTPLGLAVRAILEKQHD